MATKELKIVNLSIEAIEKNAWNPNVMSDTAFDRLKAEIGDVGFIDPIQVVPIDEGKYRILGGEHRVEAAKALGYKKVPAVVLSASKWKNEDLQKFVTVRLNVLKGKLDPKRMADLYDEMAKKYGEEALQNMFAYTDKSAWKHMLGDIRRGLKQAGISKEAIDRFDEEAANSRSVDELAVILNTLFSKYGDTLDCNFMVFTHGRRQHLYVQCSKASWRHSKKLAAVCKAKHLDINDFLDSFLAEAVKAAEQADASEEEREQSIF